MLIQILTLATCFVSASYGKCTEGSTTMTDCRIQIWKAKTGKRGVSSIKLCKLPPTAEAFSEHVRRCHFQVAMWKAALDDAPPPMDPCVFGWERNHENVLLPSTVPALLAPEAILKMIQCNCVTSYCKTDSCSCAQIGCTMFCKCEGGELCKNRLTHTIIRC